MFKNYICVVLYFSVCFHQISLLNYTQGSAYITRVINGWPAVLGEVPYQVALMLEFTHNSTLYGGTYCGAVIVGPNKLITAAHCVLPKEAVINGTFEHTGFLDTNDLAQRYAVAGNLDSQDVVTHTDSLENGQWRLLYCAYYPKEFMFPLHDIALAYTRERFYFNQNVAPIPIASIHAEYSGPCLASGYGRINALRKSGNLVMAYLNVIPTNVCSKIHQKDMSTFVCTDSNITDVSLGDSGGPLVCRYTSDPKEDKDRGLLVGIVSGHRPSAGSFFTRVSTYKQFINEASFERVRNYGHQVTLLNVIIILMNPLIFVLF